MYAPARHDETTGLLHYVDQQLEALRSALYGLTEEQARATPCRSALSVGGLVKHAAYCMRGAVLRLTTEVTTQPLDAAAVAGFTGSFAIGDDETVAGTLAEFDRARAELLAVVARTDPGAESTAPPAPWHGIHDARPIHTRFYLVHLVEEFARHAGHADIIREQIDGVAVPALVLTLAGAPANDFFTPYEAAPGTVRV
ncbi:DinB family protein [Pseudonocardia sp. ICBG1293]|uniref:DinB family protein n=1 Tax=Pseudonocardia sp. ICBG1293 TaxID=2844382 RepID=UPI001CCAF11B|nr:DinB family protein [Pseudonocardia sp. ICBG1293]